MLPLCVGHVGHVRLLHTVQHTQTKILVCSDSKVSYFVTQSIASKDAAVRAKFEIKLTSSCFKCGDHGRTHFSEQEIYIFPSLTLKSEFDAHLLHTG